MRPGWSRTDVLITTRTYPTPAKRGVEVSCTAGITRDGHWIRLFPVPYRFLSEDRRFRKYQWISVEVKKASDARKESYNINVDSLAILTAPLPTNDAWQARKDIMFPLRSLSLCALQADDRGSDVRDSLGLFKPKTISRLAIRADSANWTEEELGRLRQGDLFQNAPANELQKIPWKFVYHFTCDHDSCHGHELSCSDWEIGASYRKWLAKYGRNGWEAKFRQRYEADLIHDRDTHFHVGTSRAHPTSWMIVGLFYPPVPPREEQIELFPVR